MKLVTLGGLELEGATFQRPKPLLLLAYLSLEGQQSREHLAELFWQGDAKQLTTRQRRNNLSRTLSDLRKHAPGSFAADKTSIWSVIATDVAVFEQALASEDYACAVKTYAGSFLEGHLSGWNVELEEWLYQQRDRLAEGAQKAFLALAEQAVRWRPEQAIQHARSAFRLAEPQADLLPRFYTLFEGQDNNLVREVQDLARGYGVTLRSTLEPKFRQEAESTEHNLPDKGTSFVGRDVELGNSVRQLLQPACRLLNLVGIGGVGKSRLAIQAAFELLRAGQFQDGIYYVALDALTTEELIPTSIADSLELNLTSKDAELEQLSRYLADKHLLLILDNFEHLIEGATLLAKLLEKCPNLKIIVTSRERLNLLEEWVFPVKGLALPGEDTPFEEAQYSDAVQLFVQRAHQAQLTFELASDDLPYILELCHLVAGSPLALELAAVWLRMMSPEALFREIEHNLDVLNASARNRTERHKNLRAVFEHSWHLLSLQEQAGLKRLSVFRGGFTREAALEVTGSSLATLASLVNKSLLRSLPSGRYDRHPLVYQYTQEKLAANATEHVQLQEQHFSYFLALAERATPFLKGPEQKTWLERLERDHDNFRTALRYALSLDDTERALRLSGELWSFWDVRGYYSEGREWLAKALSRSCSSTHARGRPLTGAGLLAMQQGDYQVANDYLSESLAINRNLKQPQEIANVLNQLAGNFFYLGDYTTAASHYEEMLSIYQKTKDRRGMAFALQNLGALAGAQGNPEKASSLYSEGLQLFQAVGDKKNIAGTLIHLGIAALELEKYDSARDWLDQGLATSQELGHKYNIAYALHSLGVLNQREGNYTQAQVFNRQSLLLWQELGQTFFVAATLENLALLCTQQQEGWRAACLIGAVQSLRETARISRQPSDQPEFERAYNALTEQLTQDALATAQEEGKRMTLEQTISYALNGVPNTQ